jgi:hypothetical protein
MSDPVSDSSAVDQLREQLIEAVGSAVGFTYSWSPPWQDRVTDALLPIVAAFGDAREAAGREQGRQDATDETEAARRWFAEQGARPTMADVERLRGSGVAVQPTPEEQP